MSKALYLVIGTVDRSLRCVEFFTTYEEAAEYINNMLLIGRDEHDNAVAEMQHLRLQKNEPQDDDEGVHLIDVKAGDKEAWDNNYDLDFYIEEVSGAIAKAYATAAADEMPEYPWYRTPISRKYNV